MHAKCSRRNREARFRRQVRAITTGKTLPTLLRNAHGYRYRWCRVQRPESTNNAINPQIARKATVYAREIALQIKSRTHPGQVYLSRHPVYCVSPCPRLMHGESLRRIEQIIYPANEPPSRPAHLHVTSTKRSRLAQLAAERIGRPFCEKGSCDWPRQQRRSRARHVRGNYKFRGRAGRTDGTEFNARTLPRGSSLPLIAPAGYCPRDVPPKLVHIISIGERREGGNG